MTSLSSGDDIWLTSLDDEDVEIGLDYSIISRAYTYDRMGAQSRGNFGKAIFRIALGRAVQYRLERLLEERGVQAERDTTDYKEGDYWDIRSQRGS